MLYLQSRLQSAGFVECLFDRPPVTDIQRAAHGRLRAGLGRRTGPGRPPCRHAGADRPPVAAVVAAARKLQRRVLGQPSTPAAVRQPIHAFVSHPRLPRVFVFQPQPARQRRLHQTGSRGGTV